MSRIARWGWLALWVSLGAQSSAGAMGVCQGKVAKVVTVPDQRVTQGVFSVYYTLSGPHALVDQADANRNGLPDVVEDILVQLQAADAVFSQRLGLRSPLAQARFQGVSDIRVRLLDMPGNGMAYEARHRFPDQQSTGECSLILNLSRRLGSGTRTPAHELFHLYQYGYSLFKRPWYLEGMARWSESLLWPMPARRLPMPAGREDGPDWFARRYDADVLWQHWVAQAGSGLIAQVLTAFDALDDVLAQQQGVPLEGWSEAMQRDAALDAPMWQAVMRLLPAAAGRQGVP